MDSAELQKIAERARKTREAGIAILLASFVLVLFFFVPLKPASESGHPVTVAETPEEDAFASASIEAMAAIVYDLATETVLYGKNETAQLPLASLTKLLTVYAALSILSDEASITISQPATRVEGARTFLVGETFPLNELARLTLVGSLNDGAAAIAEAASSVRGVTQNALIASVAESLDLSQTYAINGSGLDVSTSVSGGYGSAYDIARLSGELVRRAPDIALGTTQAEIPFVSASGKQVTVHNTNPATNSTARLLLSKTGFTDLAGGNLALVFDAGIQHPIAIVVLGSSVDGRFTDAAALARATFDHFATDVP